MQTLQQINLIPVNDRYIVRDTILKHPVMYFQCRMLLRWRKLRLSSANVYFCAILKKLTEITRNNRYAHSIINNDGKHLAFFADDCPNGMLCDWLHFNSNLLGLSETHSCSFELDEANECVVVDGDEDFQTFDIVAF